MALSASSSAELSWLPPEDQSGLPMDLCTAAAVGAYDVVDRAVHATAASGCTLVGAINAANADGWTPLMYAAYIGHDAVVTLLGECAADVSAVNQRGQSALMLAASCGNEATCLALLKYSARLEACDSQGWTPLFYAVYLGHHNVVRLLLNMGARCQLPRDTVRSRSPLMQAAAQGHDVVVRLLLDHIVAHPEEEGPLAAALAATDTTGQTPLHLAAAAGHTKVADLLASFATGSANEEPMRDRMQRSLEEGPQRIESLMQQQQQQQQQQKPSSQQQQQQQQQQSPTRHPPPQPPPPLPTSLAEALEALCLTKYLGMFEEQDIDLPVFLSLSDDDLKEIGLTLLGPRRKITSYLARLRAHNTASAGAATATGGANADGGAAVKSVLPQGVAGGFVSQFSELRTQFLAERQRRVWMEHCLSGIRSSLSAALSNSAGALEEVGSALDRCLEAHRQLGRELCAVEGSGEAEQAKRRSQIWLHKVERHLRHAKGLAAAARLRLTEGSPS